MIEFVDLPVPPLTDAQREHIDYVLNHWVVTRDDGTVTLTWTKCGPECRHAEPGENANGHT